MKREDIKIGQKVSFYFSGSKHPDDIFGHGHARTVHAIVHKIHRVTVEVYEEIGKDEWTLFYKEPSELTKEEK